MSLWSEIEVSLAAQLGSSVKLQSPRPVGGGSINQTFRVASNAGEFFVKTNSADGLDMFIAEAEGLTELSQARALRIPGAIVWGQAAGQAYLAMEYLEPGHTGSAVAFGEALAGMHRITTDRFGWWRDNTIGSTVQINTQEDSWLDFWRDHRLGFQLDLAVRNGAGKRLLDSGEELRERLPVLLQGHHVEASLLHGDLWSGNYFYTSGGQPAIFDPAVYYGDREADIAMTELFGGFGRDFYAAYRNAWPLDDGYSARKTLYNLYHVLNHFNLFGGGYSSQAGNMIDQLLSELR